MRPNRNPRTKTGRKQLARHARRFGFHHDPKLGTISVRCPLFSCREWVSTPYPARPTIIAALDHAVIEHLRFEHAEEVDR